MGAASRNKGANYERRIAKKLREWSGCDGFKRTPLSGGFDRVRFPGDILTPDWWRYPIECKCGARGGSRWTWPQLLQGRGIWWEWWEKHQAECAEQGTYGLLVFTSLREPDYLAMPHKAWTWFEAAFRVTPLASIRGRIRLYLLDEVLAVSDPEWWGAA